MTTLIPVHAARGGDDSYLTPLQELHGAGHMGVGPLDRIVMALELGLETEIEYALSTLSYYLCNEPQLLALGTHPAMGHALVRYFVRPFQKIADKKYQDLTREMVALSAESLLLLRNAVQDLPNQQWLSQQSAFRKHAADALRFLADWTYKPVADPLSAETRALSAYLDVWREVLTYLLDVLDPLTCFYVDTPRSDPLVHQLLALMVATSDRHVLLTATKCVCHLMYLGGAGGVAPKELENDPDTNNCINAVQPVHLDIVVRLLFVQDDELVFHMVQFVRQYLYSQALHPQYPTVESSQLHRLRVLAEVGGSKRNLHVLMKELPQQLVARLPLVDPEVQPHIPVRLARRLPGSGVPTAPAKLPRNLYDIVISFPEPLRATTWLRCCYEPAVAGPSDAEVAAGEVTQISLWKAYENQFEAIWKDRLNAAWPNLLPAVDFIKNVSLAFPNSEAMVVNMPTADPVQPARKKFIIKGIQPRQVPVGVELGNFEALRRIPASSDETIALEVGDIDQSAFDAALDTYTSSIVTASDGLAPPSDTNAPWYSPINQVCHDILAKLVDGLVEPDTSGSVRNIFSQYNKDWLPALVYANPGLVEHGYVDGRWLQYLL